MTPLSELDRLFPAIPKPDPLCNQCDGCQAGMPVVNGIHRNTAGGDFYNIHMTCQKKKYIDPVDADETNHGPCAQGDCSDE
ncbi:TPA: hypothetical protein ACGCGJ_000430 [Stenotrophomonas maltophilia]